MPRSKREKRIRVRGGGMQRRGGEGGRDRQIMWGRKRKVREER